VLDARTPQYTKESKASLFAQVALPFLVGLVVGQGLRPESPASRWAQLSYGCGCIAAIWIFIPNPFELPPVATIPGLLIGGVLSGMFDVRRLIEPAL
jgi:hypothetical protein